MNIAARFDSEEAIEKLKELGLKSYQTSSIG